VKRPDSGVWEQEASVAEPDSGVVRGAYSFRQIELDLVIQIFEVQSSVLHASEKTEDEEVTALSTEQVLDGCELLP